jgi:hypothetical protein
MYRGRGISTRPEPPVFRLGDRSIPIILIASVFVNRQRYGEIGSISSITNKLIYTMNMFPSTTLVLFDPLENVKRFHELPHVLPSETVFWRDKFKMCLTSGGSDPRCVPRNHAARYNSN